MLSSYRFGHWKMESRVPAQPGGPDVALYPCLVEGGGAVWGLFRVGANPAPEAPPPWLKPLPCTPPPNAMPLGVRVSHMNCRGGTNARL